MFQCATGRHHWLDREDAAKCCNGYKRILIVDQPGAPLPADAVNVVADDTPARYGRRWVRVKPATQNLTPGLQ